MRMMNFLCGLMVILVSLTAHAERFRADDIFFGRPQTTNDKTIYYGSNGLHRFNETSGKFEMSTNGGSSWVEVQGVGNFAFSDLSNLLAPTAVNVPLLPVSGSQIDIGSLTAMWGDIFTGYGGNTGFKVVEDSDNSLGLSIQKTTARYGQDRLQTGNGFGIIGEPATGSDFLIFKTADNGTAQTNGIIFQTGDASLAGDSGDIWFVTGQEGLSGGGRGNVLFETDIVDFRNSNVADFSGVTVLGIAGGGGGGINWFTPVDSDILPATSNTYNIGASNNYFVSVNGATGRFATIDNLTGVPIVVAQDLTMTGLDITGLSAITVDSINETTPANGITFNSVVLKDVSNPTDPQDVATKNYVDTELASAVGFDPSSINQPLLPDADITRNIGATSLRWLNGFFQTLSGVETITGQTTQPLVMQTVNQAGNLSGSVTVQSGSSALAGSSGTVTIRSGNNSVGESGNVVLQSGTAGTTRGEISLNGSQVNANSTKIVNVAEPTALQDVATKNYVDVAIAGVGGGGGGTDWTVPIDNNITVDGGNYDLGTTSAPLQNLFSQVLTLTDKTQNEFTITTVDGVTTGGYSYSSAIAVNGGGNPNFALYTVDNGDADANPTKSIVIETGAKTAGTGNSGTVYLRTGTSSGGEQGPVIIEASGLGMNNTPIYDLADPVDNLDAVNLQYLNSQVSGLEPAISAGTTAQYYRGDKTFQTLDTDAVVEGTNLYYTDTRADARITLQKGAVNGIASLDGSGKIPSGQLPPLALTDVYTAGSEVAQLAITPIQEGDVVIRTDESKSYVHNGGVTGTMADFNELLSPTDAVLSVNGQTGAIVLTTSDISEGTNLYYTQGRFDSAFTAKDTDDLSEGATNLYYTQARFDSAFTAKSTTNLSEGTNLYFTDERVDDRVSALFQNGTGLTWTYDDGLNTFTGNVSLSPFSTTDLSEGTNLYFTDGRVLTAPLTGFTSGAGTITATDTILEAIQKLDGNIATAGSVDSVNGQSGVVVLDTDDVAEGVTNLYYTDTRAKTAVVVNSTAGSETDQAPSVSAMKSYVDNATGTSTSQSLTNNVSNQDVTGLVFDKLNVKSAFIKIDIERSTDTALEQFNETGELVVAYQAKTDTWKIYLQSFGDDAGVTFNVTSAGQVQYSTTNLAGANYSATLRFSVSRELAQ